MNSLAVDALRVSLIRVALFDLADVTATNFRSHSRVEKYFRSREQSVLN